MGPKVATNGDAVSVAAGPVPKRRVTFASELPEYRTGITRAVNVALGPPCHTTPPAEVAEVAGGVSTPWNPSVLASVIVTGVELRVVLRSKMRTLSVVAPFVNLVLLVPWVRFTVYAAVLMGPILSEHAEVHSVDLTIRVDATVLPMRICAESGRLPEKGMDAWTSMES